jgi:hypothetical protein
VAVIYAKMANILMLTMKTIRAISLIARGTANFRLNLLGLGTATNMREDRTARAAKETAI